MQLTETISYWAPIPDMTYSVLGGTLILAQSINLTSNVTSFVIGTPAF